MRNEKLMDKPIFVGTVRILLGELMAILVVACLINVGLLQQAQAMTAAVAADWVVVQGLKGGELVQVDLFKGGKLSGSLDHVTPEGVFVKTASQIKEVERGNVRLLYTRGKSTKGKTTLIGAIAGAALGGVAGGLTMERESGYAGAVAGTVGVAALVGALVGRVVGSSGKRVLLYEAPTKPR
jgi:hypothetical protein